MKTYTHTTESYIALNSTDYVPNKFILLHSSKHSDYYNKQVMIPYLEKYM